ncbi:hypothetical protein NYE69_17935 [Paenibacillus sp. FSL R5-0527]|uniref:hypothetical protein n=1 Tax=Paenibacillus sp. FSL R5-0527 TaxID=2975321 RepID=UPI00097A339D|nr:hypothetical protein BK140_23070 [Paenibacillus macerans]
MAKYSDEEIRDIPKITVKIAADYLGISPNMLTLGMCNDLLPFGFAVRNEDHYRESWSYAIVPERLIPYNHSELHITFVHPRTLTCLSFQPIQRSNRSDGSKT